MRLETQFKLSGQTEITKKNKNFVYIPTPTFLQNNNYNIKVCNSYKKLRESYLIFDANVYHKNLRTYQNEDVSFILKRKNSAIFNEQRLGKTPTALVAMDYKLKENPNYKVLIIAPKSTLISWQQSCMNWTGRQAYVTKGTKKKRIEHYNTNQIIITTYETASRDYLQMPIMNLLIVDEVHRLRNFKGQQSRYSPTFTKHIMSLSYRANERIVLTGTPAPNYAYNIFPILHFLFPKLFTSYWKFLEYYYVLEQEQYNWQGDTKTVIKKFKPHKEKELQEFLEIIAVQRKRKNHMQWIPPVDVEEVKLELTNEQYKLYHTLTETWEIPDSDICCQGPLDLMIRLRQLSISPSLLNLKGKSNKTQWILDYIKDYPDEQIIITSFFSSYLRELHTLIPNTLLLTGETSTLERKNIENKFNCKQFNVLLGNIQVIKEGMTLEEGNTLIIVDPSLTYSDNEQTKDRIIPTTQNIAIRKTKQQIIKLISKDSIDEYIAIQLSAKKSNSEIINNFKERIEKRNGKNR